jgi:hypothetical protein
MVSLGWGIIGCADIAKKFVRSIAQCHSAHLVAIGSRTVEKVNQFAEETGVTGVQLYGSYQEVLNDPNVQAVYIPLPTTLHLEWVTHAAGAGKHILLEKPVALSAEDFQQMILVCRLNNVFLMDGTMFMHHPRTAALQETLQDPNAGTLRRVNACFNFSTDEEFLRTNIRVRSDGDPLGVLGDLGWYCIRLGIVAFSRGSKSIARPVRCSARCSKWTEDRVCSLPISLSRQVSLPLDPSRGLGHCLLLGGRVSNALFLLELSFAHLVGSLSISLSPHPTLHPLTSLAKAMRSTCWVWTRATATRSSPATTSFSRTPPRMVSSRKM